MKEIDDILNKIGIMITHAVGTMYCAILFGLLALTSFPAAMRSGDPVVIVGWIAQTFLQLVLLSIIMVGQRHSAEQSKKHHEEHLELIKNHHAERTNDIKLIHKHLGIKTDEGETCDF
jgi:hypothetical protein